MRKIVFIIILSALNVPFLNAGEYSVVTIKGYYVTKFHKNEITNSYIQKVKKIKGLSYSTYIDFDAMSYFMPIQIGGISLINNEDLYKAIEEFSDLQKDSIYYVPTTDSMEKYIERTLNEKVDLSKEVSLLQQLKRSYPYYIGSSTDDDNHIYKCIYMEGKAFHLIMDNTEENRARILLDVDGVKRRAKKIHIFFISEISKYTLNMDIPGFKKWLPYIEY